MENKKQRCTGEEAMKLEEKISKFHTLSRDYEKLSFIVHSMKTNEDAPVYNVEWGKALQERFNQVYRHTQSLIGDLGLCHFQ